MVNMYEVAYYLLFFVEFKFRIFLSFKYTESFNTVYLFGRFIIGHCWAYVETFRWYVGSCRRKTNFVEANTKVVELMFCRRKVASRKDLVSPSLLFIPKRKKVNQVWNFEKRATCGSYHARFGFIFKFIANKHFLLSFSFNT